MRGDTVVLPFLEPVQLRCVLGEELLLLSPEFSRHSTDVVTMRED